MRATLAAGAIVLVVACATTTPGPFPPQPLQVPIQPAPDPQPPIPPVSTPDLPLKASDSPPTPPREAAAPPEQANWRKLGRFFRGESWYQIVDGPDKRGYAHIMVSEEDGFLVVTHRMRQLQHDPPMTVIENGWFSYDQEMRLAGYVYNGQGKREWYSGRVVAGKLKVRGEGREADAGGTSETVLTIEDPQPIPVHVLGQVARFLPQETGLRIPAGSFSPTLKETVDAGYFMIGEKAYAGYYPQPLAGRLVFYVGDDGYVSRTWLIDELGNMLIQCKDVGLTLTTRWLKVSSPADALSRLPEGLEIAEEDTQYVPASVKGGSR